jgi:hypothetical protein
MEDLSTFLVTLTWLFLIPLLKEELLEEKEERYMLPVSSNYKLQVYIIFHSFIDSTFEKNDASDNGCSMYLNSGTTQLTNVTFDVEPNPSPIYISGGNFTATDITIANSETTNSVINKAVLGGGIHASNLESFVIQTSTFTYLNYAKYGGAIYAVMTSTVKDDTIPDSSTHRIIGSTFTNNKAYSGGAVYVSEVDHFYLQN